MPEYLVESAKIANMPDVRKYTEGNGLDLGAGQGKIRLEALGIDFGSNGIAWVGDVTDLHWFKDNVLDYVFSSHCLEHVIDDSAVLREWMRAIKPGGYIILYLPDDEEFDNTEMVANGEHKHVYTLTSLMELLANVRLEIIKCVKHTGPVEGYPEHSAYSLLAIARKPVGENKGA